MGQGRKVEIRSERSGYKSRNKALKVQGTKTEKVTKGPGYKSRNKELKGQGTKVEPMDCRVRVEK
jgi:hypothetical protein